MKKTTKGVVSPKSINELREQQEARFKTQYNQTEIQFEENNGKSETKPDETMSIQQMIDRFVNGRTVKGQAGEPLYSEDEIPNFDGMDLTELAEYGENLQKQIKKSYEDQKTAAEAKYYADQKIQREKEIEYEIKKRIDAKNVPSERDANKPNN